MAGVRSRGGATLFHGQRKSKKTRECDCCHVPICKGEYYFARVQLIISEDCSEHLYKSATCLACGDLT